MKTPFPHLNAPKDGYVFVVTYGRSGSTLLQNLLNALPGYCIRGENANTLAHLAMAWQAVESEEAMRGERREGNVTTPDHPWYGAELVRPNPYGRSLADTFVREVLHLPAGTRVGGFKEIRFHNSPPMFRACLGFIRSFFPGARLIFNTRSHDAVVKSGWWAKMPEEHVRKVLGQAESLFDDWIARHPDMSLKLHYDDYVGQPDALRGLYDFLGEPFDETRIAGVMDRRLTHPGTRQPMARPQAGG